MEEVRALFVVENKTAFSEFVFPPLWMGTATRDKSIVDLLRWFAVIRSGNGWLFLNYAMTLSELF